MSQASDPLERRLLECERALSFAEMNVARLDDALAEQQQQMDRLEKQLILLQRQLDEWRESGDGA